MREPGAGPESAPASLSRVPTLEQARRDRLALLHGWPLISVDIGHQSLFIITGFHALPVTTKSRAGEQSEGHLMK